MRMHTDQDTRGFSDLDYEVSFIVIVWGHTKTFVFTSGTPCHSWKRSGHLDPYIERGFPTTQLIQCHKMPLIQVVPFNTVTSKCSRIFDQLEAGMDEGHVYYVSRQELI
jgi:hypothetical protein